MASDEDRADKDRAARDEVLARVESWRRRAPRLADEVVTMAHGAGGKASQALLEGVIRPAFSNPELDRLDDGAVLDPPAGRRLALTTDSFVVTPRRFAGGSIGDLAVNGTVNDLAAMGAEPRALALAFVLEEGLAVAELRQIAADAARAADRAGAPVVTGDTKVVERGAADGCYITSSGVGWVMPGLDLGAERVRPGDAVLVSGTLGDHGAAVMVARGDLALASDVNSDTAPLWDLARALLTAAPDTRWMRDPTRGGLASACNELAAAAELGVRLYERRLPVRPEVAAACELLGLDPLHIANEGKLAAVVPAGRADAAVAAMRSCDTGADAAIVGEVTDEHPGLVVIETALGGTRIADMLVGDPLPRIC